MSVFFLIKKKVEYGVFPSKFSQNTDIIIKLDSFTYVSEL